MRDATVLVKDALIATLQENDALTAIGGGRVYDVQPSPVDYVDRQPFTSMGEPDATPWGNDGYRGSEVTVQVDNWAMADETSVAHVRVASQMNAAVVNALWGPSSISVAPDSPAEWIVHHVWIEGTRVLRDPDGVTAHGIVTVVVQLTPAIPNH